MYFHEFVNKFITRLFVGNVQTVECISDGAIIEYRLKTSFTNIYYSIVFIDESEDWSKVELNISCEFGNNSGISLQKEVHHYGHRPNEIELEIHFREFSDSMHNKVNRLREFLELTRQFQNAFPGF